MPGPITRLLACDEDRLKTCAPEQPAHGNASRGAQPWSRRSRGAPPARAATNTRTWCPHTCTPTSTSCTWLTSETTTCRTTSPEASSTGALPHASRVAQQNRRIAARYRVTAGSAPARAIAPGVCAASVPQRSADP
jgi:hypothetical protein